jgi:hypothetical protein
MPLRGQHPKQVPITRLLADREDLVLLTGRAEKVSLNKRD